jgi:dihydroorotate dehydrogenase
MFRALQPLLLRLDAERAHALTLTLLNVAQQLGVLQWALPRPVSRPLELMGLKFPNRIGLAAGFDKNATCIDALGTLGFGFIELGTVTPEPQPGNPRPRIFRLPEAQAVINRMGFPNEGVAALTARLRMRRFAGICGVNIGKNAATPLERASRDYTVCLRAVYPFADYVAVNVSSPNTAGLRELQREAQLRPLLEGLLETRARLEAEHGRRLPLLVKLSPDLTDGELSSSAGVIRALRIDGVIATNTTMSRPPGVAGLPRAGEAGGLSGPPLLALAAATVRRLRAELGAGVVIVGVGGIHSAESAREMFAAGADLLELYTGLVYRGPRLVRELSQV